MGTEDSSVSTFGWDTAYIAPFPVVNKAILAQKSYPAEFSHTDETGIAIKGSWTSWQLAPGGAGGDVQMLCEVRSGSASGDGHEGDLSGATLVIQVNLRAVAAAQPIDDPTAKPHTGTSHALVVDTSAKGLDPAVSIISSTYPNVSSVLLKDLLDSVFKNYFNARIGEFNHVFHVVNLNGEADEEGFQWLKPTALQYAVASPEDGSIENSVFGLLAMVQGHPIQPHMQQAVDVRALTKLPEGANSAFVISGAMVAQNMLLQGARAVIQGSSPTDFGFSEDGLSVVNVNDLVWGNFQTANGLISPKISKNNFTLRVDDTYVYLEISNAQYETSPGVTVHMNVTQKFSYDTVRAENGSFVFIPDTTGLGSPSITANVSLSEGLVITQVIASVVAAVASLLAVVAPIASAIGRAASVAVDAAADAAEIAVEEAVVEEAVATEPAAVEAENEAGAEAADAGAAAPGDANQVQNAGIFASTQYRLATGITAAIGGAISGSILAARAITQKRYDKIPAFDTFAANCLGASKWPGLKDYRLVGASFRSSLVIAVALEPGT